MLAHVIPSLGDVCALAVPDSNLGNASQQSWEPAPFEVFSRKVSAGGFRKSSTLPIQLSL